MVSQLDDEDAKKQVSEFLDAIGYDALDAGPLAQGWRFQRDTAAYSVPYFSNSDARPSLDGQFDPGEGRPVGREQLAARLAEAKRYRDQ